MRSITDKVSSRKRRIGRNQCSLCILLVVLLACGCVDCKFPLLNQDQRSSVDRSLAGTWRGLFRGVKVGIVDEWTYEVSWDNGEGRPWRAHVRTGKIGTIELAEVEVISAPDTGVRTFAIVGRTKTGVRVSVLSPEWLRQYAAAHPEVVTIESEALKPISVRSSTKQFQALLQREAPSGQVNVSQWTQLDFVRSGASETATTQEGTTHSKQQGMGERPE